MQNKINTILKEFEQKRGKIDLSLNRIDAFLKKLGSPHLKTPPVVHIAGTNGKGSTLAFLRAMIEAEGKTCHLYTSPHLVKFNERIVLNSREISDDYLYEILDRVNTAATDSNLTFFELATAAAFLAFCEIKSDYLLLETGLGGRLDATNLVSNPLLTIITSISYDHTEFLGKTLSEIATEKAGIMKPSTLCISAPQVTEVEDMLKEKAQEISCKIVFAEIQKDLPSLSLAGEHQNINASVAVHAARHIGLSESSISKGLQTAKWPARMQRISRGKYANLLPSNFELWLDGGHNEAGAEKIAAHFCKPDRRNYLIIGMMNTKNAKGFLGHFAGKVSRVYTVSIPDEPNSYSAQQLADIALELGIEAKPAESAEKAIMDIVIREHKQTGILIAGSLYLAGKILGEN